MKVKFTEDCSYFNFSREKKAKKGDVADITDEQVAESLIKQDKCKPHKEKKDDKKEKKDK